jgi:hypothetical protein
VESFDEKPRCLVLFEESCRSKFTKKAYLFELKKFLKYAKMDYEQVLFLEKTELTDLLVDYVLHRKYEVNQLKFVTSLNCQKLDTFSQTA